MKKIMMTLAVACAAFLMACGSPTDKAKSFADDIAAAKGDQEKIAAIMEEMDEYVKGLSEEEKEEFNKVYKEAAKALNEMAGEMAGEMEDFDF